MIHALPISTCAVEILHSEGRIGKYLIANDISLVQTDNTFFLAMEIAQRSTETSRRTPGFKNMSELADAPALMKSLQFVGSFNDDVLRSLKKQSPHAQWKLSLDLGQGDVIVYAMDLILNPFNIALRIIKLEKRLGPMQNLQLNWPVALMREDSMH